LSAFHFTLWLPEGKPEKKTQGCGTPFTLYSLGQQRGFWVLEGQHTSVKS